MIINYFPLKDIVSLVIDYRGKTPLKLGGDWSTEGYRALSALNVKTRGLVAEEKIRYVNEDLYKKWMKEEVIRGDILITSEAPFGQVLQWDSDEKIVLSQRLFALRIKPEFCSQYIYQYMASSFFYAELKARATGSTVEGLRQPALMKCKIGIPDISIQKRIASILTNYDALINNNNKRIHLLEQVAENLYNEWFVRFRYPEYEEDTLVASKLGKIPSSFDLAQMYDVFDYYIGGGWGNDNPSEEFPVEASVIRGADFPGVWKYDVSSCPVRYHKESNYKSRKLEDGDIVMEISGGTAEQPVGRTVLVTQDMINRFKDGKVICASFCKLIRLKKKKISPYFFYFWMHYLYDTRIIDRFQLQSTGIINFKFESFLRKGLVMMPPKTVMDAFDKEVAPIFKEMNVLAQQNVLLIKQRDLLLPRLMSGKLEVSID